MSDEVLVKLRSLIELSYIVNNCKVSWSETDDMGIDVVLHTVILNDGVNTKEFTTLVKKIRNQLMRGYNVHITNKFTL